MAQTTIESTLTTQESHPSSEDSKSTNKLYYGSIISLSHASDLNSFVYTDGFIKRSVTCRNFSQDAINRLISKEPEPMKRSIIVQKMSFSRCLFLICPVFSNVAKNETQLYIQQCLKNMEEELAIHKMETNVNQGFTTFNLNRGINTHTKLLKETEDNAETDEKHSKKVKEYQKKIESEFKYNIDTFEKLKESLVSFYQPFQLIHLNSSKFLACSEEFEQADFEKENFKLTLRDFPGENTVFKFHPAFKYQKDGDQIVLSNETVALQAINPGFIKLGFLNISDEISVYKQEIGKQPTDKRGSLEKTIILEKKGSIDDRKLVKKRTNDFLLIGKKPEYRHHQTVKNIIKREVNVALEDQPQYWKINIFSLYEDYSRFLKAGDVIWLHHIELNASLTILKKTADFKLLNHNWVGFNPDDNADSIQDDNIYPIFLVNQNSEGKARETTFNGNTFGMWVIENVDYRKGDYICFGQRYRLKHLSSGRYLSVIHNPTASPDKYIICLKTCQKNTDEDADLFQFFKIKDLTENDAIEGVIDEENRILKDSFVIVRNINTQLWINARSINETEEDLFVGDDLSYAIQPNLTQTINEKDTFRLFSANQNEVWELNVLLSGFPLLYNFSRVLEDFNVKLKIFYCMYENILEIT